MNVKDAIKNNRKLYDAIKYLNIYNVIRNKIIAKNNNKNIQAYNLVKQLAEKNNLEIMVNSKNITIMVSDGRKFYYYPHKKNSLLEIAYKGTYEPENAELFSRILEKGDTVIDIGANFGWYSTLFSHIVGNAGQVHSFEPILDTFNELKANIEINKLSDYIVINNIALGETDGKLKMFVPEEHGSAWASRSSHGHKDCIEYECQMLTLDNYLMKRNLRDIKLIKCDVEGAELLVLKGATNTLSLKSAPIWFLEVEGVWTSDFGYKPKDLFEYMGSYGYEIYYLRNNRLLSLSDYNKPQASNYLFVKSIHKKQLDL